MRKIILTIMMALSFAVYAQTTTEYTVQRGETLESISKKFGVSINALKQANKDVQMYLYTGMKLVIPQTTKPQTPEKTKKEEPDNPVIVPQERPSGVSTTNNKIEETPSYISTNSDTKSTTPTYPSTEYTENGLSGHFGVIYDAGSFDDIKTSGHYGLLLETYHNTGSGLGCSMFIGGNLGLIDMDSTSILFKLGPNYSFGFNDGGGSFIIPFYVSLAIYGEKYKELTGHSTFWGWAINPKVSIGIMQIGLQFSGTFKEGSVTAGFTAGLVF